MPGTVFQDGGPRAECRDAEPSSMIQDGGKGAVCRDAVELNWRGSGRHSLWVQVLPSLSRMGGQLTSVSLSLKKKAGRVIVSTL